MGRRWNRYEITPVKYKNYEFVMLLVYPGSSEEYITFISPEAYPELKEYMVYREENGEKITPESYVVKNKWRETNVKHGAGGLATNPRQFKSSGIKRLLERAREQARGLRKPLPGLG